MSNQSRIEFLGIAELDAFFKHHTKQGSQASTRLGHSLLHLMELLSSLVDAKPGRTGTVRVASSLDAFEGLAWVVWDAPTPDHPDGSHVMNGGLVHHSHDNTWGIHT